MVLPSPHTNQIQEVSPESETNTRYLVIIVMNINSLAYLWTFWHVAHSLIHLAQQVNWPAPALLGVTSSSLCIFPTARNETLGPSSVPS